MPASITSVIVQLHATTRKVPHGVFTKIGGEQLGAGVRQRYDNDAATHRHDADDPAQVMRNAMRLLDLQCGFNHLCNLEESPRLGELEERHQQAQQN